jgi:hypothetical protein
MAVIRGKRGRGWASLLLPLLFLRALIPVGFMPMIGPDHSVRLVICDNYAPLPAAMMDMPMAGMDMSQHPAGEDSGGGPPVHQDHGGCPFGASPALGAVPTLAIAPILIHQPAQLRVAGPQIDFYQAPDRAQSPRGPPA